MASCGLWQDVGPLSSCGLTMAQIWWGRSRHCLNHSKNLGRDHIVRFARRMMVEWVFNPPHASYQGGVWERIIRTIRKILVALLSGDSPLSDDALETLFCETENIVNSRQITKVSYDVHGGAALTPELICSWSEEIRHCHGVSFHGPISIRNNSGMFSLWKISSGNAGFVNIFRNCNLDKNGQGRSLTSRLATWC